MTSKTQTITCSSCGAKHETRPMGELMAEEELRRLVAECMITYTWSRDLLLPLPDDMTGKCCVLKPTALGKRWQLAKFQLVAVTGGFGCKADSLGSKVFGHHLADEEDCQYTRSDFIGEATPELIEACLSDTRTEAPFDPNDKCYLVIGTGMTYGRAADLKTAKANCKRVGGKPMVAYHCHAETYINDMAMMCWSKKAEAPVEVWRSKRYQGE